MVRVRVIESPRDLASLEGRWRDALRRRPAHAFQHFEVCLAHALAFADVQAPLVIVVEEGAETALLALARGPSGRIGALGQEAFDYIEPVYTSPAIRRALAAAVADVTRGAPIDLLAVRGDSPSLDVFRALGGGAARLDPFEAAHHVALGAGRAPFFERHRKSHRLLRTLARRHGARGRVVERGERVHALRWLVAEKEARLREAGEHNIFADSRRRAYMDTLAELAPPGLLLVHALEAAGRPLAMVAGFDEGDAFRAYVMARGAELAPRSPGAACLCYSIDAAERGGAREYDLLRGDEPYKRRWADGARPLLRVRVDPEGARARP